MILFLTDYSLRLFTQKCFQISQKYKIRVPINQFLENILHILNLWFFFLHVIFVAYFEMNYLQINSGTNLFCLKFSKPFFEQWDFFKQPWELVHIVIQNKLDEKCASFSSARKWNISGVETCLWNGERNEHSFSARAIRAIFFLLWFTNLVKSKWIIVIELQYLLGVTPLHLPGQYREFDL